jgi:hypothetical protein
VVVPGFLFKLVFFLRQFHFWKFIKAHLEP